MSEEVEVTEEVENEVVVESTYGSTDESQVEEVEEKQQEEKPKSGYIDYNALPDEVRDTVKMRVDGDYRKLKSLEKKEAEYQKQIKEYEDKLAEVSKPKEIAPPTPDDFYNDPDKAEARLKEYNDYVAKNSEWSMQQKQREQQHKQEIERLLDERQQTFLSKSKSAGIDEHELGYAASVVAPKVAEDVASYLMEHEYGPQILVKLAKDPMELQEIASLNPYQVGVKLDKMAKAFKPTKKSNVPPPDDPIQGSGVDSREDYPILKGAQFL